MKKYVLDTNVILSDPNSILAFEDNTVILPFTVLEELDSIKGRNVDVSRDARVAVRNITAILDGSTHEEIASTGVPLKRSYDYMPAGAKLQILSVEEVVAMNSLAGTPIDLATVKTLVDSTVPDDKIILVSLLTNSVLVTRDINMRIKAMVYGVEVQDYRNDIVITDSDLMHVGNHFIEGDIWEGIENVHTQTEDKKTYHFIPQDEVTFLPAGACVGDYFYDDNDALLVLDGEGEYPTQDGEIIECYVFCDITQRRAMNTKVWDIKAKNIQQAMAINSILDPDVHITVLLGSAGTGKTLITMATALELVGETSRGPRVYDKIIFTKTQDSQFEDIGFLPGSEFDKVGAFCGAALDALEFLHKDDHDPAGSVEQLFDRNIIQFKALNFVRGRSFANTILIVDEFQNITPSQAKTILSRAGVNCKVIIMGNTKQIDNKFITPINSGLTYVVEKMKDWEGCRVVELEGILRSELAEYAENNL